MLDAKTMTHPAYIGGETVPRTRVVMPLKSFVTVTDCACAPLAFKSNFQRSAELMSLLSLI